MSDIVVTAPSGLSILRASVIVDNTDIMNPGYTSTIITAIPGKIILPIAFTINTDALFIPLVAFTFLDFINLRFNGSGTPLIAQGLGNINGGLNMTFPIAANGNFVDNLGPVGADLVLTFTINSGNVNEGFLTVNVFYFSYTI